MKRVATSRSTFSLQLLFMVEDFSSAMPIVLQSHLFILTGTDVSQNLIVFYVSAQAPLKLIATNYPSGRLQFMSFLFGYDLLGFIDGSKPCPSIAITLSDATPLIQIGTIISSFGKTNCFSMQFLVSFMLPLCGLLPPPTHPMLHGLLFKRHNHLLQVAGS